MDCLLAGAGGGTRTHTSLRTTDFESVSSANSNTPADVFYFYHNLLLYHALVIKNINIAHLLCQPIFYVFVVILW